MVQNGVYPCPSGNVVGVGIGNIEAKEFEFETFRIIERNPDTVHGTGAQSFSAEVA